MTLGKVAASSVLLVFVAITVLGQQQPQPELVQPQIIQPQAPSPSQNVQTNQAEQTSQPSDQAQHSIQFTIPSSTDSIDWQNLTEQQKKKLLQQQAKLTQYHKNPQGDITATANLTIDQKEEYQRKLEQRAKVAYENAMREMEKREKQYVDEYNRMMAEQKLTMTQEINHKEQVEFRERQNQFNPRQFDNGRGSFFRHQFNEYMFELDQGQSTDFALTLPVAQEVAFFFYTYSNKNGVYSMTSEISESKPPQVQVIQNNYKIIRDESFYFRKYIVFSGKDHFTYTIKVINQGESRLFALSVVHLLESSHIASAIDSQSIANHAPRARAFYEQIEQKAAESQTHKMMEISNQHKLNKGISVYYSYIVLEIVVVIAGCWVQLKMVEKLLRQSSIV